MRAPRSHDFVPPWQWGIFRRKACRDLLLDRRSKEYDAMTAIYQALKRAGFNETYWQFVYRGQIGGLVKNPRGTLLEFHVRFFEDGMIYAEIELGRSVLLHFLNRRCYINQYLARRLRSRLPEKYVDYFQLSTERYKCAYHRNWPEWTIRNRFVTLSMKKQIHFLTTLSDWRVLALIMLGSTVSSFTPSLVILPLVTATMIVVYLLAPRRS